METRRTKRIYRLTQALKSADKLHLKEAARLLGVSEMTVRRDLNARSAPVALLGGYVVSELKNHPASHYFLSEQQTRHMAEKRRAGALAARLIDANDTVFFDCGTTVTCVIEAIPDELPFTGVCYSFNTFLALQEKPHCKPILCGGQFHPDSAIFTPLGLHHELDYVCPNKAFMSAAGIELQTGATCFNFAELTIKRRAIAMAQHAILIADSSKFGLRRPACIGPLTLFDTLITECSPERHFMRYCADNGIVLLTPGDESPDGKEQAA